MSNKFENIYMKVEQGFYDQEYFSVDEGKIVGVSVKKLKSECSKQGVNFKAFLTYARSRKAEEMEK